MNRIEAKMALLKEKKEKAFVTYMVAGLPDLNRTKELLRVQEEAGVDVVELGIPFSDPVADGPVIQDASYQSICLGTSLQNVFQMMKELRKESMEIPVVFMMYYNTILHYGLGEFAKMCRETGVDGLIVPDLPLEEQEELQDALQKEAGAILIQMVSPASKKRLPAILKGARGFVSCVSSMGAAGQENTCHREVLSYLREVKEASDLPVFMGFESPTPKDVAPMRNMIDGVIVGSHFVKFLQDSDYSAEEAKKYCRELKQAL